MESLFFQVSAKTARLIGRDNISDVDGAIVELVKNGYDADADCVFVKYSMPYDRIPQMLSMTEVNGILAAYGDIIKLFYQLKDGHYILQNADAINIKDKEKLERVFSSCCEILVIDNGCGMSRRIIKTAWMNIGTDDKEVNIYSRKKNRTKTGAKGIGRFALDKLSRQTKVITKSDDDVIVKWQIDWSQFDDLSLLNQVKAEIQTADGEFVRVVQYVLGDDFEYVKNYDWTTGTLISLTPVRDFWNKRLYKKVNDNLRNVNPFGSVDKFDIIIRNEYYPEYNYVSESRGIERADYDYCIDAEYDGDNSINIVLDRNELDVEKEQVSVSYSKTDIENYSLDEFWAGDAFKKEGYARKDFNGRIELNYTLQEIMPQDETFFSVCRSVGPFTFKAYYLKNQKSTLEIVRAYKSGKRKDILKNFSGVKLYRDNFKVRPYGDKGQYMDWINLSERVQKSPAAASHESGKWRVSPNQLIGSVSISRVANPHLADNANREGMKLNREYDAFILMLQGILDKFEMDRQYPLREYALWINKKKNKHKIQAQKIYEEVKAETERKSLKNNISEGSSVNQYGQDILKATIYVMGRDNEKEKAANKLLRVLSSTGVMVQTFTHEIARISTELGSRGRHLQAAIDMILNYQPYEGDEDFNPYDMLEDLNNTDRLLANWVDLIMDSIKQDRFVARNTNIADFLKHIKILWEPLLDKKYIKIYLNCLEEDIELSLPVVDLHLLVNNFMLNSAYYLEAADGDRKIEFKLFQDEKKIYLEMFNNGPVLDSRYAKNPNEVLEPRETTKKDGTGLGLWIAREAVEANSGRLYVEMVEKGFLLKAEWQR